MVAYLDHLVGRLLAAVEEAGLAGRTWILFTGDNGSAIGGRLGGEAVPAGKGRVTDLGAHVPMVVRAPGLVPAGRVLEGLACFTDLFPSVAELCGAELPAGFLYRKCS